MQALQFDRSPLRGSLFLLYSHLSLNCVEVGGRRALRRSARPNCAMPDADEPMMKYQRLGASVTDLLAADAASCLAVHEKFLHARSPPPKGCGKESERH